MMKRSLKYKLSFPMALLALTTLVCFAGCGDGRPKRVKVSGQVTIDGKPIASGGIQFMPAAGGRMGVGEIENGQYSAMMYAVDDGLPTGDYKVRVSSVKNVNDYTQRWFAPQKYSDVKTSGLTASITEETNSQNFDLTWDGVPQSGPYNVSLK